MKGLRKCVLCLAEGILKEHVRWDQGKPRIISGRI